ncbi:MAG: protein O-GlcNAc transferase, partial [Candidatus Binatota bacterium]|nr:protein O-GlcNAc transferase [Candidatus Binatota bacterium]
DAEARCGLWVVDLRSGVVAHWLELEGVVAELYDVQVLPGVARPMALGFKTDEIQRTITIDVAPRPTFQALAGTRSSGGSEPPTETVADGDRSRADAEYAAANVLVKHGKLEQAIARYVQALVIEPSHLKALLNLGTAQARLGRSDAALDCFRRALDVDPGSLLANSNVAAVLESTGDLDGAIRHWELALRSRPGDADLLLKMWLALYHDGRLPEAKHHLERAIRARPDFAEAHNALGAVLTIEERFDEALRHHDEAARLRPDYYEAHLNAGKIHEKASRLEEAKAVYGRASAIRKDPVLSLHAELLCPPVFPSSEALDAYRAHATAVIDELAGRELAIPAASVQSSSAEPPFDWAYHGRDNLDLKRKYAALFESSFPNVPLERVPSPEGPWRIGFVVTPGHEGVFARCMNAIIDRLDRRRFEVALVCSHASYTAIRSAFANPATRHVNLPLRFDLAAAALRAAAFDAIYYWEVGTDATNYFLPFQRLAPVQLTSWGWPDTSGAPELDFHLTSESLAPDGIEARFTEKLVRLSALPASFPRPPVPTGPRPPSHLELPRDAHLYVCAQTLRKLHPDFDALLGGILRRDRRGVAVFVEDKHRIPSELLRARWRDRLPDVADRMIFVPRLSWEDYFRLIASADVSLDPLYFGGSNTTYDALANGVPVVTLPWELPRGRYAAALCRKLDVEECIATTADDYVERALTLAGDSTRRAKVRAKIAESNTTIFADPAAVVELESFLAQALLAARGD